MNSEQLPNNSQLGNSQLDHNPLGAGPQMPPSNAWRQANPLGAASVAVAAIGLAFCFGGALLGSIQQQKRLARSNRIANTDYQRGDPTVLVENAAVGLTFLSQLAIYGVSALIGGTFSLVGFALGVAGLTTQPKRIALIGIGLSPIGPLMLLVCFLLL